MPTAAITLRPDYVRWGAPVSHVEGVNERCIELPLGLEVADLERPGWVLDAGCALLPAVDAYPSDRPFKAHIVHVTQDISREPCKPHAGLSSYVSADLRNLSIFANRSFERVVCLSTLEHVGFDNRQYGGTVEDCPETASRALAELWRVTGKTLLLSVPFTTGEPWQGKKWRYFTEVSLARLWDYTRSDAHVFEVCYYSCSIPEQWEGPTSEPVELPRWKPEPVRQIAVVKVTR